MPVIPLSSLPLNLTLNIYNNAVVDHPHIFPQKQAESATETQEGATQESPHVDQAIEGGTECNERVV